MRSKQANNPALTIVNDHFKRYLCLFILLWYIPTVYAVNNDYFRALFLTREVYAKAVRENRWRGNNKYNCKNIAAHYKEIAEKEGFTVEKRVSFHPDHCKPHMYVRVFRDEEFVGDFLNHIGWIDMKENKSEFWGWWFTQRPKICGGEK